MKSSNEFKKLYKDLIPKVENVKIVLTDNDGVLTDTGVYYSSHGEEMKRFSIRDGMGVERLRKLLGIETGIITGEFSNSVKRRAEKLKLKHLYLGVKDKKAFCKQITKDLNIKTENIAYIGDDYNDLDIIEICGFTACPGDAMPVVTEKVDYVCESFGGNGAFREFAELIIALKKKQDL